ncbi:hypothetical protein Sjap_024058 [Stephania japonica]|uniref:Uncharacterized protein n=1 Tax=Stephania japonica TaxID=461633 RepID=A0AAP0ECR9_9MAGN
MSFCFDSNPQIIHRYLDHLESMLMLWGSQSPARDDILNEQYFLSKLANLEDFWANIEVILECGSEEMKERARRLRCEVTIGCDNLITKRLEALDPLLDFMGKMTRRSVREVERETCEACKDEFGNQNRF